MNIYLLLTLLLSSQAADNLLFSSVGTNEIIPILSFLSSSSCTTPFECEEQFQRVIDTLSQARFVPTGTEDALLAPTVSNGGGLSGPLVCS